MKFLFVFQLFIFGFLVCPAQPPKQYSFTHFSTSNGLVTNIVNGVVQDLNGYIWLATIDGLQRYDGNNFLTFRNETSNSASLPENYITAIYEDKNANLWVWAGGKIGIFNTTNFRFTGIPLENHNSIHSYDIRFLGAATNGYAAIYVENKGIYTYDPKNKLFELTDPFNFPRGWEIYDIRTYGNATMYYFGCKQGIAIYNSVTGNINYQKHNTDNLPIINFLKDTSIVRVCDYDGKQFWYADWPLNVAGAPFINSLDLRTGEKKQYSIGNQFNIGYYEIANELKQKNGRKWFYGRGFLVEFTGNEKKPFLLIRNEYRDEQSIKFDMGRNMYEDRQNNIWISTDNGVFLFNPDAQSFSNYSLLRPGESESSDIPTISACELTDGRVLLGTWGKGLYCYDKNFNPIDLPVGLKAAEKNYSMWAIHQHSKTGRVWMGLQHGELLVYDPGKHIAEFLNNKIFDNSTIRQIAEDHNGNLWFGMQGGQVIKWDMRLAGDDIHKGYVLVKSRNNAYVQKVFIDKQGYVWMASMVFGLYKYDPASNREVLHITNEGREGERLWANSPFDIFQYNDSTLLIANGAIDVMNIRTNKITHITTEKGLPSNTVNSFERDNKGALWLGLANGLCRMNFEKMIFSKYDRRDGIKYDIFNPAGVYKLKDGRLIYPTDRNFIVFDPLSVHENPIPPDAVITDFKLANRPLRVDSLMRLDKITLPYDNTSILIEFNALNYVTQNKFHYQYMLEGIDDDWQETADFNQAIYNYIPPGDYIFRVRARNNDGVPSNQITTLQISVSAPFWKTWWFFGMVILFIILMFYLIDKERVKRLQVLQAVRTQIAQNLHMDVNTTLNNISVLSEMAKIKADKDIVRAKEYIDQIRDKSKRMIDAMDDMLWTLNPQNDSMRKTILRMKEYAEGLQTSYNSCIEIEIDPGVKELKLGMKSRHELYFIFKEVLRTLIAYTDGSPNLVNIDLSGNKLVLKIQNSEARFTSIEAKKCKEEMKERARLINAELDIQCDNKGVSIILLLSL